MYIIYIQESSIGEEKKKVKEGRHTMAEQSRHKLA